MKSSYSTFNDFMFHTLVLVYPILLFRVGVANNRIVPSEPISIGQSLVSNSQVFELGFFSPDNSERRYVGLWYVNASEYSVVWVANRGNPLSLTDRSASLEISEDGNLRVFDGVRNTVWSTNISAPSNNTYAILLDNGSLTLNDNSTGVVLWSSYEHPHNVFLGYMQIGMNIVTGERSFLTSWRSEDDPSPGNFVVGVIPQLPAQFFIWNGSAKYWRSGPWNGEKFDGMVRTSKKYEDNFIVHQNNEQLYVACNQHISIYSHMVLTPEGSFKLAQKDRWGQWHVRWVLPNGPCDVYGTCGPFGICDLTKPSICSCPKGFLPRSSEEWESGNWSGGCVRRTELQCQRNITTGMEQKDGFMKLKGIKLPDNYLYLYHEDGEGCRNWCHNNCSCIAYAYASASSCLTWSGDVIDMHQSSYFGEDIYIRLAASELVKGNLGKKLAISLTTVAAIISMFIVAAICMRKANQRDKKKGTKSDFYVDKTKVSRTISISTVFDNKVKEADAHDLPLIDLEEVNTATNGFSQDNKIGEGGFGPVFKGKLENGQEIAVKKLSSCSGQGIEELKNEILLISKLQHRNLVRVIGCCIEKEENLIVYEYLENRSLDTFIFDAVKGAQLNWSVRFNIILGVARGLLYLHHDSRLRVIHRDLKASNILLDNEMNPKISDFGLARTFLATQNLANTHRVVGTYGYMAPEYAMRGIFSEKSDVYSFGVLMLEIITGKKCCRFFCDDQDMDLLGYAWWLWNEGSLHQLVDETLIATYSEVEFERCAHIGLLCVQEDSSDRPTMSTLLVMLSSDFVLPNPKKPTCFSPSPLDTTSSINEVTLTICEGR